MARGVGDGTTIAFGTTGFNANLVDVSMTTERAEVDQTHMGTTTIRDYAPSNFLDVTCDATFQFDPALTTTPIDQPAETVTIDWAGSGDTSTGTAFVTSSGATASIGELMEAPVSIRFTSMSGAGH